MHVVVKRAKYGTTYEDVLFILHAMLYQICYACLLLSRTEDVVLSVENDNFEM